jgi:hypothetical protein
MGKELDLNNVDTYDKGMIQSMKETTLDIKTVYECNRCLGTKTWHPQASIIDLENPRLEQESVKFEFYAILLSAQMDAAVADGNIMTSPMRQWCF